MIDKYSRVGACQIAALYALRGQLEAMFQWLDRTCENHDGGLVQLLSDPFIMSFREDARLAAFCRRLNIERPQTD